MNRADVEMLNSSLGGLGNSFAQARRDQFEREQAMQRLALESQIRDIQEKRYGAQEAHFQTMEESNADRAAEASRRADAQEGRQKALDEQTKLKQSVETFKEAQMQMQNSVKSLGQQVKLFNSSNGEKGISNADANDYFKKSLSALPPEMQQKMQSTPEYQMIDSGKFDWETAASAPAANVTTTPGGQELVTDAKGHVIKGAPPARPGSVADETYEYDAAGHKTRAIKTTNPIVPAAPVTPVPAADNTPTAPLTNFPGFNPPPDQSQSALAPFLAAPSSPTAIGSPVAAPVAAATPPINPPPGHVAYLKANANNPKVVQDFEQKYGAGSAQQYLQGP